jgi:hypothetical protein
MTRGGSGGSGRAPVRAATQAIGASVRVGLPEIRKDPGGRTQERDQEGQGEEPSQRHRSMSLERWREDTTIGDTTTGERRPIE